MWCSPGARSDCRAPGNRNRGSPLERAQGWYIHIISQAQVISTMCAAPVCPAVPQTRLSDLCAPQVQTTGVLEDDAFLEEAAQLGGMLYARPLVEPGAKCVCAADGLPTWIGEMMVAMSPVEEAIRWIKQVEEDLSHKIKITPKSKAALGVQ
jgi:hypothetical protein